MEEERSRIRQHSEECDWEKIPTPTYLLNVTEVKYDANSRLELRFSLAKDHELKEGTAVFLVPSDSTDGDISRFPTGQLLLDKLVVCFDSEATRSLGLPKSFHLVSKDDDIILSSDFSISEDERAMNSPSSKMIASVEDWDDGILPCSEEQQKLLDRMEEEVTVARLSIQKLELKEEQLKSKVEELETSKADCQKENEELKVKLKNALAEATELRDQMNDRDAALAESDRRLKKSEEEREAALVDIEGLRKLVREEQSRVRKLTEDKAALQQAQEGHDVTLKSLEASYVEVENMSKQLLQTEEEKEILTKANQILSQQLQQAVESTRALVAEKEDAVASSNAARNDIEVLRAELVEKAKVLEEAVFEIQTLKKQLLEEQMQRENILRESEQLKATVASKRELEELLEVERNEKKNFQKANELLKQACSSVAAQLNTLKNEKEELKKANELLKQACATLSAEKDKLKGGLKDQQALEAELKAEKEKLQAVAKRLVAESTKSDALSKRALEAERKFEEMRQDCQSTVELIAELNNEIEEKDHLLGRKIQEVERAEADLKRGLNFLPEVKHRVDTVVTVLLTEMESLKKLKENSETSKKALSCIKLCYQKLRTTKDELDEIKPNTETSGATNLNINLPRINDDVTKMSRDDMILLIADFKARIKEAYKDFSKVNEERKELRRQLNMPGQAAMPIIRKSEGDIKKWLKDVGEGGADPIFAGTIECQSVGGSRQCILPTFFKSACPSAGFAIEDLGRGTCADCPTKSKDVEIWLKTSAKGVNRGRSSFVDVSSSFAYKPGPIAPVPKQEPVSSQLSAFDPDEDQEVFYDASYCEPAPKKPSPAPVYEEPKKLPCPDCSHIFEAYEEEEFQEHLALHSAFATDIPEDDPFNFGI